MEMMTAIQSRHSVRKYLDRCISEEIINQLQEEINACNNESGLNIQLITNNTKAFEGMMAHYGKFSGVQNYIALIGEKTNDFDEKTGYYGERIVLKAQMLGLNTCWVAMTFSKSNAKKDCTINPGEKLGCVISLGYGITQGDKRKSKNIAEVIETDGNMPSWFKSGVEAALLAPTAINQQKFMISLNNNTVSARSTGGICSKVDLGIVKYHFEIGAGTNNFTWA
ncbi:MAG: nitroreductase family protein [Cellulosilyticaceae bacterium]